MLGCRCQSSQHVGCCIERCYEHVDTSVRTIDAKCLVAAVCQQVLQLYGTAARYAHVAQFVVQRGVGGLQFRFHEHFAYDVVDIWRVYSVTSKVARTFQSRWQCPESVKTSADISAGYFHRPDVFISSTGRPVDRWRMLFADCSRRCWHRCRVPRRRNILL